MKYIITSAFFMLFVIHGYSSDTICINKSVVHVEGVNNSNLIVFLEFDSLGKEIVNLYSLVSNKILVSFSMSHWLIRDKVYIDDSVFIFKNKLCKKHNLVELYDPELIIQKVKKRHVIFADLSSFGKEKDELFSDVKYKNNQLKLFDFIPNDDSETTDYIVFINLLDNSLCYFKK